MIGNFTSSKEKTEAKAAYISQQKISTALLATEAKNFFIRVDTHLEWRQN